MPRRSGRYLRQQKLSDQNSRRIIRCFAQGLPPKQAANAEKDRPAASVNAIYEIYHLLRMRLFDIGYFPSFETIKRYLEEDTAEPPLEPRRNLILQAIGIIKSRRGIKESTEFIHLSELVFRILETEATVESVVQDIERLIKITGPLNEPPPKPGSGGGLHAPKARRTARAEFAPPRFEVRARRWIAQSNRDECESD